MPDSPTTRPLRLRQLGTGDLPALQRLLDADPGYARRVTGADPGAGDAADLLGSGPPDVPPSRKLVLGVFEGSRLVAVVDVLRGWPDGTTAHVGLLQVHADDQGRGIGRRTHDLLVDVVAGWPEVTTLRAAIVATNATEAEPFWSRLGYRPSGPPRPYQAGRTATEVTIWTRAARAADEEQPR